MFPFLTTFEAHQKTYSTIEISMNISISSYTFMYCSYVNYTPPDARNEAEYPASLSTVQYFLHKLNHRVARTSSHIGPV